MQGEQTIHSVETKIDHYKTNQQSYKKLLKRVSIAKHKEVERRQHTPKASDRKTLSTTRQFNVKKVSTEYTDPTEAAILRNDNHNGWIGPNWMPVTDNNNDFIKNDNQTLYVETNYIEKESPYLPPTRRKMESPLYVKRPKTTSPKRFRKSSPMTRITKSSIGNNNINNNSISGWEDTTTTNNNENSENENNIMNEIEEVNDDDDDDEYDNEYDNENIKINKKQIRPPKSAPPNRKRSTKIHKMRKYRPFTASPRLITHQPKPSYHPTNIISHFKKEEKLNKKLHIQKHERTEEERILCAQQFNTSVLELEGEESYVCLPPSTDILFKQNNNNIEFSVGVYLNIYNCFKDGSRIFELGRFTNNNNNYNNKHDYMMYLGFLRNTGRIRFGISVPFNLEERDEYENTHRKKKHLEIESEEYGNNNHDENENENNNDDEYENDVNKDPADTKWIYVNTTHLLPSNKWSHLDLTVSKDGVVKIYINGVLDVKGEIPVISNSLLNYDYFFLGRSIQTGRGFFLEGSMCDFRFYNYERKSSEIKTYVKEGIKSVHIHQANLLFDEHLKHPSKLLNGQLIPVMGGGGGNNNNPYDIDDNLKKLFRVNVISTTSLGIVDNAEDFLTNIQGGEDLEIEVDENGNNKRKEIKTNFDEEEEECEGFKQQRRISFSPHHRAKANIMQNTQAFNFDNLSSISSNQSSQTSLSSYNGYNSENTTPRMPDLLNPIIVPSVVQGNLQPIPPSQPRSGVGARIMSRNGSRVSVRSNNSRKNSISRLWNSDAIYKDHLNQTYIPSPAPSKNNTMAKEKGLIMLYSFTGYNDSMNYNHEKNQTGLTYQANICGSAQYVTFKEEEGMYKIESDNYITTLGRRLDELVEVYVEKNDKAMKLFNGSITSKDSKNNKENDNSKNNKTHDDEIEDEILKLDNDRQINMSNNNENEEKHIPFVSGNESFYIVEFLASLRSYGEEVFYDFTADEDRYTLTLRAQKYEKLEDFKNASVCYARAVRLAVRDLAFIHDSDSKQHTREVIENLIKNSKVNWSLYKGEIPEGWDVPLIEGKDFEGNVKKNKYRFFSFEVKDILSIKIELEVLEGDGDLFACNIVRHPTSNAFTWASVGEGSDTIDIATNDPHYCCGKYYVSVFGSTDTKFKLKYTTKDTFKELLESRYERKKNKLRKI